MTSYAVNICYKGTAFEGYQLQPGKRTVAGEIRIALSELFGEYEKLTGCSRTDSGVHANDYCFSLRAEKHFPCETVIKALNNKLPTDIRVKEVRYTDLDFNARYSVTAKEYIYLIENAPWQSPFMSEYAMHYPRKLDTDKMNSAAALLVGKHDFSAFRAASKKEKDPVRNVFTAGVEKSGNLVTVKISADGFLYRMVRMTVGALIRVSEGKLSLNDIEKMLLTGFAPIPYTAEAKGLFLNRVYYE